MRDLEVKGELADKTKDGVNKVVNILTLSHSTKCHGFIRTIN
ncbi:hypothetical protein SAMN05444380_11469 [Thermophagus xiamenensis]|uniref:Uncharacterized protein n=1 Tax=Thermophagus xiamenensis TaxID=385682 RepID=A0A1I2BZH3_9BACT|nr:hypothetical protein SAMN05444380_11469 [Thermophagus xiamenensis]